MVSVLKNTNLVRLFELQPLALPRFRHSLGGSAICRVLGEDISSNMFVLWTLAPAAALLSVLSQLFC